MGYSHVGGNVFKVAEQEDVLPAYNDWILNEMEDEDNAGFDLDITSIPAEGYPLNVGFYRNESQESGLDICKVEMSDDAIHDLWMQSGAEQRG